MRAKDAMLKLSTMNPEEPVFVLRAQDLLAPETIEFWATLAETHDVSPSRKVREARECADLMAEWTPRKLPD